MLAHFLASQEGDNAIFNAKSISLMGYSLGSQVMKSTLNRLAKLNRTDLIQNVYCLAGATNFEKSPNQLAIFNRVVHGRICNVYEAGDRALNLFRYVIKKEAIGNVPQYTENQAQEADVRLENYDVDHFVEGHLDYRVKLGLILDTVNFDA